LIALGIILVEKGAWLIGVPLAVVGYAIAALGLLAATIKYLVEAIKSELS
jgi:hypothetical protein